MAQRYSSKMALAHMSAGDCPECGKPAEAHIDDNRFWIPRECDLLPQGVADRVQQYRDDLNAPSGKGDQ